MAERLKRLRGTGKKHLNLVWITEETFYLFKFSSDCKDKMKITAYTSMPAELKTKANMGAQALGHAPSLGWQGN